MLIDPHYYKTGVIDVLLDSTARSYRRESNYQRLDHEPIAARTQLGWIISGATPVDQPMMISPTVLHCATELEVNDLLQKFWLQEEL